MSPIIKSIYRDNIHLIYQHLHINDILMDRFEQDFKKDVELKIVNDPWKVYIFHLNDMIENYVVVQKLISELRAKNPRDVFYRHAKHNVSQNGA